MSGHTSIWSLSHQLGTYPDLIAGLCTFHTIPIVDGPRGRLVRDEDVHLVVELLEAYRVRPRLSYLSGRTPRPRRQVMRLRGTRRVPSLA